HLMGGHGNGGGDQWDPQVSVEYQDRDDCEADSRADGDRSRQISAGPRLLRLLPRRPVHRTLARLAILADAVQFLHRLAADVAHRDPGVFALGFGLLDQFATAFLGQLRYRHPDQRAVVGRINPQVGVANRRLDGTELARLVRLEDD